MSTLPMSDQECIERGSRTRWTADGVPVNATLDQWHQQLLTSAGIRDGRSHSRGRSRGHGHPRARTPPVPACFVPRPQWAAVCIHMGSCSSWAAAIGGAMGETRVS